MTTKGDAFFGASLWRTFLFWSDYMFSEVSKDNLAKNLKEARKSAGYTQQEIADILGLKRATYAKIESGASFGTFETLVKVSELLGVSIETLLGTKNSAYRIKLNRDKISKFETVCKKMGISPDSAINIYINSVIKQNKIPFEVSAED